jgi:hypothetical protein
MIHRNKGLIKHFVLKLVGLLVNLNFYTNMEFRTLVNYLFSCNIYDNNKYFRTSTKWYFSESIIEHRTVKLEYNRMQSSIYRGKISFFFLMISIFCSYDLLTHVLASTSNITFLEGHLQIILAEFGNIIYHVSYEGEVVYRNCG